LRDVLARLDAAVGDPPYNMVVHGAPPGVDSFHWYVEVVPRLSVVAGFEQATGILVNSVPPERAARTLNDVDLRRAATR
jgi:UDPglucose--hexose-1-phosphate uridylyltransferase